MPAIKLAIDDIIKLKKAHPCGTNEWRVVKLGMEVGLVCQSCGRRVGLARGKLDADFRGFVRRAGVDDPGAE